MTELRERLKTKAWGHNMGSDFLCVICGDRYQQDNAAVSLFDDDEKIGDICPQCIKAGADGAARNLKEHAARLRRWADDLVALAREVAVIQDWATISDLKAVEHEFYLTRAGNGPLEDEVPF